MPIYADPMRALQGAENLMVQKDARTARKQEASSALAGRETMKSVQDLRGKLAANPNDKHSRQAMYSIAPEEVKQIDALDSGQRQKAYEGVTRFAAVAEYAKNPMEFDQAISNLEKEGFDGLSKYRGMFNKRDQIKAEALGIKELIDNRFKASEINNEREKNKDITKQKQAAADAKSAKDHLDWEPAKDAEHAVAERYFKESIAPMLNEGRGWFQSDLTGEELAPMIEEFAGRFAAIRRHMPYKDAIKQATSEFMARVVESDDGNELGLEPGSLPLESYLGKTLDTEDYGAIEVLGVEGTKLLVRASDGQQYYFTPENDDMVNETRYTGE